jgi:hypothetical protein
LSSLILSLLPERPRVEAGDLAINLVHQRRGHALVDDRVPGKSLVRTGTEGESSASPTAGRRLNLAAACHFDVGRGVRSPIVGDAAYINLEIEALHKWTGEMRRPSRPVAQSRALRGIADEVAVYEIP